MKPAVSTLILYKKRHDELIKTIKANPQIVNWEIVDEGFHSLNSQNIKALKELASTQTLNFAVHGPFSNVNIAEIHPYLQEKFAEFLECSMANASKLNAKIFITHPGRISPFTQFFPEEAWKAQTEMLKLLAKRSIEYGITLAIENMAGNFPLFNSVEEGMRILDEEENIGVCLDVGHAHISNRLNEFIQKIPRIYHMHIHDNAGVTDEHLPVGDGTIDWNWLLNRLKNIHYKDWLVAENYELKHALQTLNKIKLYL